MNDLPPPPLDFPASPDFSFMKSSNPEMISGYSVVHNNEAWNLLSNFKGECFQFTDDPKISTLMDKINDAYEGGHSGGSIGCLMRKLEYIAKNGFSKYKQEYIRQNS
jgi:hypothetical protein